MPPIDTEKSNDTRHTQEVTSRGRLTIFLGYADGIGKTHAMLGAARQRAFEGLHVVIGCVDERTLDTNRDMIERMEVIPGHRTEQNKGIVGEIDIEAIIARHPDVVIIDDLAQVNRAKSGHSRRYQDVEELLNNCIDVYTTLNIYQIESLQDMINQSTGLATGNTVPDYMIDINSKIELVDLAVEALLQRYEDGSILIKAGDEPDVKLLYRKGTLMSLRELTLRKAANQIREQLRNYREEHSVAVPDVISERLMVCISSHPLSERLVRTGRRLVEDQRAEWDVVYVQTPERLRFSSSHRERISQTIRLAEELGAKVHIISGRTVPEAVLDFARRNNITTIIVGRPIMSRWVEFFSGSIVDNIIRHSGAMNVYVVSDESGRVKTDILDTIRPKSRWERYAQGIFLIGLATLISFSVHMLIKAENLVMIYLLAVTIAAFYLGRGPSLLASLLGALAFDFFFTNPRLSFTVDDTQYLITFLGLVVVSLVVSSLAGLVGDQVEASQKREIRTSTLYTLSQNLTTSLDMADVLHTIIQHISMTFSGEVVILLPQNDEIEVRAASADFILDQKDKVVARWSFRNGQPAGRGTENMTETRVRFQPLKTVQGVIGVLGVKPLESDTYLNTEQRQLLEAYSSLAAMAIERARLAEQANQVRVSQETEKLQTALLNSISHDLRTPLASITGIFSSLHEVVSGAGDVEMDEATRIELIDTGWEEAERLNRLVGNLLDMTRVEAGAMRLNKEDVDIEDIIGAALARLKNRLRDHIIRTYVPPVHPLLRCDFMLIEQVLVNLLDNAAKYSEPGGEIKISVWVEPTCLEVSVADHGLGIPESDLIYIFNKFYQVQRHDKISGTGLGLSICKGIIETHGGKIWAENNIDGGAVLSFSLPVEYHESSIDG